MIADKILGNTDTWQEECQIVKVKFAWFELEKKRISKTAEDGENIGVCIPELLKDKDVIGRKDNVIYAVELEPEHLIKIQVHTMKEMGRLCFELGNRHLSLQIEENMVKVPFDQPTFEYLKKLGFQAEEAEEKFTDFIECKAHGQSAGHSHGYNHEHSHEHDHSHGANHHE